MVLKQGGRGDQLLEVIIDYAFDACLDIGILAYVVKVLFFDLLEELLSTGISYKESLSGPACLESDLSSIFEVTNQ